MKSYMGPRNWVLWNCLGNRKYSRFGNWDVKSQYRADSLKTVASELAKFILDIAAVQEDTWVVGGSLPTDD
jgi:hypothetical protein